MSKIEKIKDFYSWLYGTVKSQHVITDIEFENIIDKL